jgi:hypothetical protein
MPRRSELPRQRYDLDFPSSRVVYIDHDNGQFMVLGYVVWPTLYTSYHQDKDASRRMIEGMSAISAMPELKIPRDKYVTLFEEFGDDSMLNHQLKFELPDLRGRKL